MLESVAYDVQIEPALQPLTGKALPRSANSDDEGRLDISARGFWQRGGKAFFDVRIFNPFTKSHLPINLKGAVSEVWGFVVRGDFLCGFSVFPKF